MLVLIYLVLCFSCSDKKEAPTLFLQNNVIQLAPPRITASSTIIDSTVIVKAELKMDGVSIRYTDNGEIPTEKSELYKGDLKLSKARNYKFKAFHKDWEPSEVSEIQLFDKGQKPKAFLLQTSASEIYPGQGLNTLFNNKKGSLAFRDVQWMGYDTISVMISDFKAETNIKKLTIGYLTDTKSWIFPPESVSIIVNNKDSITVSIPTLSEGEYKALSSVKIPINKNVETVKVSVKNSILPSWHPGNGNSAWLFMDEWIFN